MRKRLWILALVLMVGMLIAVLVTPGASKPETIQKADSTIVISEVCAKNESVIPDNDGKYRDYIELYNSGAPVSLKGFAFYDGKTKSDPIGDITLETGEYRVFFISRSQTGFALSASGGDTVQLLNGSGRLMAQTNTAALNADEVMLLKDGTYSNSYAASPGFSNDAEGRRRFLEGEPVQELPLMISEVLLRNVSTYPDENGFFCDMVELCNFSDAPIDLGRYFLSDDVKERFCYRLPQCILEPGEYLLLFCDGENYISDSGLIHTNFGLSHGESLVLTDSAGAYISLNLESPGDDTSIYRNAAGEYVPGFASLGYENTEAGAAAMLASRINTTPQLEITEVLLSAAGVPYNGAFCDVVEITNVSDAAVSTSGWFLSDGGDPYDYPLPENMLKPGECIVIVCGKQTTGFSLSDGEILRLTGPDYRYGPPVVCSAPETGKSISRIGSGESGSYTYADITLGYPNAQSMHRQYMEDQLPADLRISEVMSSNRSYLKGPYGTTCDWIELYNASSESVQLSDYCITDNKNLPGKYPLPEQVLEPGAYCVILLSDDPINLLEGYPVIPMPLSVDGESLYLTCGRQIVDYMLLPAVPSDMSWGRAAGSGVHSLLQSPTPGNENGNMVAMTAAPIAMTAQGCYDNVEYVDVVLTGVGDIYYTTDCEPPTEHSRRYTGPIRLTQTTVLRVMCREEGKLQSETVDFSYIINENDHLPVVSLVTDTDNLWSDETGIYVMGGNASAEQPYYGANFWMDWEKPATVSLFETDGSGFSAGCGIKIFGNYSRMNDKKSMSCLFRSEYGQSELVYPLFGEDGLDSYESFLLRSGGQDVKRARMRDELVASLVRDYLSIPVQDYRPVILYLNGQYWGLYYIREKISEHFLAGHYNTEAENVAIVYASDEKKRDYWQLMDYVSDNDMRIQENYDYACSKMDMDNFIDFMVAQMWIANTDIGGNVKYFVNPEGKWTWIIFDTDISLINSGENRVEFILDGTDPEARFVTDKDFLAGLIVNPDFRDRFLTRMAWQMNHVWAEEIVLERIDEFVAQIGPDMEKETARWNDTCESWEYHVESIRRFATSRNRNMLEHVQSYFRLTDEQMRSYGFNV